MERLLIALINPKTTAVTVSSPAQFFSEVVTILAGTAATYGTTVMADAPVLYWRMGDLQRAADGNATYSLAYQAGGYPRVLDWSGNGNYGVLASGSTLVPAAGAMASDRNGSLTFDGSGELTVVNPTAAQSSQPGTNQDNLRSAVLQVSSTMSIEAWVQPTAAGIGAARAIAGNDSWTLQKEASGAFLFRVTNGSATQATWTSVTGTTIPAGGTAWYHVVATHGPAGSKLYVNGVLEATTAVASKNVGQYPVTGILTHVGGTSTAYATASKWTGGIDEVALYATELTQARITAHHAARTAPDRLPYDQEVLRDWPGLYWRLNDMPGSGVADASGNGRTGLFQGTPGYAQPLLQSVAVAADDRNTLTPLTTGQGRSISFGGACAIVLDPATDATLNPFAAGTAYTAGGTVSLWVRHSGGSGTLFRYTSEGTPAIRLASGAVSVKWKSAAGMPVSAGTATAATTAVTLTAYYWHHVLFSWTGATYYLAIDGVAVQSVASGFVPPTNLSPTDFRVDVGRMSATGTAAVMDYATASIAEVAVFRFGVPLWRAQMHYAAARNAPTGGESLLSAPWGAGPALLVDRHDVLVGEGIAT